jgi:hypothetical protein
MYGLFTGQNSAEIVYNRRLNEMKMRIRNAPDWFHSVELKAKANKISTDSMITIDAIYMLKH